VTVVDATLVECPTCGVWIGWACEGDDYGYHAAGYHLAREKLASQLSGACGIPARTLPPCDLPWGHDGRMHCNMGDGFYARDYDEEHAARQEIRGRAKKGERHERK